MERRKIFGLVLGCLLFTLFNVFHIFPDSPGASLMFSIVVLMGTLWLTEALPLGITALLPIVLFPLLHLETSQKVSQNYFNSTIFLFLGGFIISIAIESTGLHRRIALGLLSILGTTKYGIFSAFTLSSFTLSMFISNTATALIITPIALSILKQIEAAIAKDSAEKLAKGLLLSVAYSASIGGIATLIGTPPNLIFQRIYQIHFPDLPQITFARWLGLNLPLAFLLLVAEYVLFYFVFLRKIPKKILAEKSVSNETSGKISSAESKVLVVFAFTCLLWIFRENIDLSFFVVPGWSNLFGLNKFIDDGTVAIFSALLFFILPRNLKENTKPILTIDALKKVPWDIILLFGGGFAIADGFENTGLSNLIAQQILGFLHFPQFWVIVITSSVVVATTEFSSNTAVASAFLPIIAAVSVGAGVEPIRLMLPATISASLAFMLPVSTPPNAVVFSTGKIKIQEMAIYGVTLNLIGIFLVAVYYSLI